MINILWVDDQHGVVKTFSELLSKIDTKIETARSGSEALKKLYSLHIDLVILDLMMPPGEWGGLWLLKKMKEGNIQTPVIIVSGEGSQSETIKGLRLGAKDYVVKDNVEQELLNRVKSVLSNSKEEIERNIKNSFLSPLAIIYKRYKNSNNPTAKLRRLVEFYEMSLKLCDIIGVCELAKANESNKNVFSWSEDFINGPSMGTWNQIRYILAKQIDRNTSFFQFHTTFKNNEVNNIIKLRNDISHGAEPSERSSFHLLEEWRPRLEKFASRMWKNLQFEMFYPESLDFDGCKFQARGRLIVGDSTSLPMHSIRIKDPLVCSQVYLYNLMNGESKYTNLYPFVCIEPALEPSVWKILVYDGVKKNWNTQRLIGNEPIRYIDVWSGKRISNKDQYPTSASIPESIYQNQ